MPVNPKDAWTAAYTQLEMQLDRPSFETWLRDAVWLGNEKDTFIIGVRSGYAQDMLQHRLYRNVRRVVSDIYGHSVELRFELCKQEVTSQDGEQDMPLFKLLAQQDPATPAVPLRDKVARPQRPDLPECELNPRYTFDRFISGNENPMVYPAARAIAERPGMAYNPFLVYGGVGLGKTHLLHAIGHECQKKNLRVVYISSEAFTNDLVDAIRHKTTAMFREKYRSADVLLVDDIQFMIGKETTQEEFFHTFNALHMFNKQIVLAADRHPAELDGIVDRLRSRFQSGLVVDVQTPGLETRVAIVQMWAHERGIRMPASVAEFLANRAKANIRELESVFNQAVAAAQLAQQPLDAGMVEAVLDGFRRPRQHLTVTQIIEFTAKHHGLTVDDLIGPRRNGAVSQARQIGMYLAREVTKSSLSRIGEAFGGRKHSTVLHSYNKIRDSLGTDEGLRSTVTALRSGLLGPEK